MTSLDIIDVIIDSFSTTKNNDFIDEKIDRIILGNSSNIPNMYLIAYQINNINPNMKIEKHFKDSFIIKYGKVYCWVSYYRNNEENLIDFIITGHLNINEILKEIQ